MKKIIKPIYYFSIGFLLMASLQLLSRCEKDDDILSSSINPEELKVNIDYKAIEEASENFQEALSDGNQSAINNLIHDEAKTMYQEKNIAYTAEEMSSIAKAIQKKELVVATQNYAEYTYKIDGKTYTFTMGCDENGEWKIVRY